MFLLGASSTIAEALYYVLNYVIDYGVYYLLNVIYDIFFIIAKFDIFGSTDIGQTIYNDISSKVYSIISLFMVFIFAYNLLLYIMKPENNNYVSDKLKPTTLLKRIVFSVVIIILAPLIYRYMSLFQNHVLMSDSIPAIVLGDKSFSSHIMTPGKKIALITYNTFIHPENMNYASFINDETSDQCESYFHYNDDIYASFNDTEQTWAKGLINNCGSASPMSVRILHGADNHSANWTTFKKLDSLQWLSGIGGITIIIFGFSYIFVIAARVFRLFALQILSPIPIFMRIFNKEKNFDPWLKEISSTYIDIFARVAIISFVLYFITLLPLIVEAISDTVIQGMVGL